MAKKTSIANPVVTLGLDADPLAKGLAKTKTAASAAAKEISKEIAGASVKPARASAAVVAKEWKRQQADAAGEAVGKMLGGGRQGGVGSAAERSKSIVDKYLADAKGGARALAAKAPALKPASVPSTGLAKPASGGGLFGALAGAGGGLAGLASKAFMPIIAMNQATEFAAKISKTVGAPVRALMGREQLQAQFTGIGTIDPSTSTTFTAGIARFGMAFDSMLADIAETLDRTFDLKGILEYARGALTGISALMTAFFGNLEPIVKDPEALTKQFKAGALMVVNVFETVGVTSVKVVNYFIEIYKIVGGMKGLFSGMIDQLAIGLASALEAVLLVPAGTTALLEQQAQQNANAAKAGVKAVKLFDEQGPVAIANQARNTINAMGVGPGGEIPMTEKQKTELLMRQANVIMGKIGSDLMPQISSKIAPLMVAGSSQLEDALVKAQLQGQAGDIQQRIEAAIQSQITLQTQQVKVLDQIRLAITGKPGLAILGNN